MSVPLLACPFCGSVKVDVCNFGGGIMYVVCLCGASGRPRASASEAAAAWNARTSPRAPNPLYQPSPVGAPDVVCSTCDPPKP